MTYTSRPRRSRRMAATAAGTPAPLLLLTCEREAGALGRGQGWFLRPRKHGSQHKRHAPAVHPVHRFVLMRLKGNVHAAPTNKMPATQ